jgi:hypothetical protein
MTETPAEAPKLVTIRRDDLLLALLFIAGDDPVSVMPEEVLDRLFAAAREPAEIPTPEPLPAEALQAIAQAISGGMVTVCYARCCACQFGECPDPPTAHTWMDQDDAEHAGHPWPLPPEIAAKHPCACPCAKETSDA